MRTLSFNYITSTFISKMSSEDKNESENQNTDNFIHENEWMLRPCKAYIEEYKDCRGIKARLHQYFIYGETIDCTQWKRDYDSCLKYTEYNDLKAMKALVKSETERRLNRLRGHYNNTVWEKRDAPPEDWNKPLPDYITKNYDKSYLYQKYKEDEEKESQEAQKTKVVGDISSMCVIS